MGRSRTGPDDRAHSRDDEPDRRLALRSPGGSRESSLSDQLARERGAERPRDSATLLLDVDGLRIEARVGGVSRPIVTTINLAVAPGESVAIVGESGSGKSLTARALVGLLPEGVSVTAGRVTYRRQDLTRLSERAMRRLRGAELSLILQDPFTMLNPLLRCGAHIEEMVRLRSDRLPGRRARRAEAERRLVEVGISETSVLDRYPFQLSGGMRQRVAIAAALARDPKLLIADEPSTALDVTTQKDILALLKSIQHSREMGLILITHDLRVAFSMCDRIYVLYAGSVVETGPSRAVETDPLHPYTLGLLKSEPPPDRSVSRLAAIAGSVPTAAEVADACAFAARCQWAQPVCCEGRPDLVEVEDGRLSACRRIAEIRDQLSRTGVFEDEHRIGHAHSPDTALVRIENVCKTYESRSRGKRHLQVEALREVSLEVASGESVGLVGESGSGKTTLARCLVGLDEPTSGRITVDGIDAVDRDLPETDRRRLRQAMQIVFQDPYSSLNPMRTVGATLREAFAVSGRAARPDENPVADVLARVGLPAAHARRKPVALSGGERQRVAIARALAVEPKLLICDEPVSALDVSVQAQILNLLKDMRATSEMSYLFITHDLAVVRQIVDRLYVLYQGRVVEAGPVSEVLDNPTHEYTARLVSSIPRSSERWLA